MISMENVSSLKIKESGVTTRIYTNNTLPFLDLGTAHIAIPSKVRLMSEGTTPTPNNTPR